MQGVLILIDLLLNEDNVVAAIDKHKALLQHFTDENTKAQKYFLGGIEGLVGLVPERLGKVRKCIDSSLPSLPPPSLPPPLPRTLPPLWADELITCTAAAASLNPLLPMSGNSTSAA